MTKVWKDIDPNYAESALRALNRRLADLDNALNEQRELLRARPDSFAFQLANRSLVEMQTRLQEEREQLLLHRVAEKINIALDGGAFDNNSANIGSLGTLLIRLQKLYSSLAQSISQGPRLRGPIAAGIAQATQLRLASTYPSSFGMSLVVTPKKDLFADSLPSTSLAALFGLLSSATDEEEVMRLSGEFGGRPITHFKHVITVLAKSESTFAMEWSDSSGIKHYWNTTPELAKNTLTRLDLIKETRAESKIMIGRIVGASLLRNRFELIRDDGTVIEGNIAASAINSVTNAFGQICSVNIDETEVTDRASGDVKTYYSLTGINLGQSPALGLSSS